MFYLKKNFIVYQLVLKGKELSTGVPWFMRIISFIHRFSRRFSLRIIITEI